MSPFRGDGNTYILRKLLHSRHVRFGSKADIRAAKTHVRFTPDSDRNRGLFQTVMSALPPKADMCSALAKVRFGPKAEIVGLPNRFQAKPSM
jgi:hypothetical protein